MPIMSWDPLRGCSVSCISATPPHALHCCLFHKPCWQCHIEVLGIIGLTCGLYMTCQGSPATLHDAARVGDDAAIARLIGDGADVNEKDKRGITPLGVAVGFNRLPCVKLLLDSGADVHLTDARGSTVLHYAAGGFLWWPLSISCTEYQYPSDAIVIIVGQCHCSTGVACICYSPIYNRAN